MINNLFDKSNFKLLKYSVSRSATIRSIVICCFLFEHGSFKCCIVWMCVWICLCDFIINLQMIMSSIANLGSYSLLLTFSDPLTGELLLLLVNLLFEFNDACLYPRMLECLFRCHSFINFPLEALVNKIDEQVIIALHHFAQALSIRYSYFPFRIWIL